jgi:hypothetical protein
VGSLVSSAESRLADGGLLAILAGLALRWAIWFVITRNSGLLDTQLITGGILLVLINLAGLFLPRSMAAIPMLLGMLGWVFGLSLVPRYLWPTGGRPQWMVWGVLGLAAASFLLRWLLARRWSAQLSGKGWAWIDNWAKERSLRARVLARRLLLVLGYRRAHEVGAVEE